MADLMVEWADLVGMPLGPLLSPQAAGGSSSSLNKAYSIGPSSSRSLLGSPPAAAAAGAGGAGAAAGQEGAHLDVLLLQVRHQGQTTRSARCHPLKRSFALEACVDGSG
jgi:hypothetical protein